MITKSCCCCWISEVWKFYIYKNRAKLMNLFENFKAFSSLTTLNKFNILQQVFILTIRAKNQAWWGLSTSSHTHHWTSMPVGTRHRIYSFGGQHGNFRSAFDEYLSPWSLALVCQCRRNLWSGSEIAEGWKSRAWYGRQAIWEWVFPKRKTWPELSKTN